MLSVAGQDDSNLEVKDSICLLLHSIVSFKILLQARTGAS